MKKTGIRCIAEFRLQAIAHRGPGSYFVRERLEIGKRTNLTISGRELEGREPTFALLAIKPEVEVENLLDDGFGRHLRSGCSGQQGWSAPQVLSEFAGKEKARLPKQAGFLIHERKFNLPP
jgi:hypothetical protein